MPVHCENRGSQYRIVETATGKIATTVNGKAHDGGGHTSKAKCEAQARAINSGLSQSKTPHQESR